MTRSPEISMATAKQILFWSQRNELALFFVQFPKIPDPSAWKCIPIYKYYDDGQMQQRGTYPNFKATNEHEGLAKAILTKRHSRYHRGGYWFNYLGDDKFANNMVDASYTFSRCAAGQFIEGGRPEIILVVGDGKGHSISMNTKIKHGCLKPSLKKLIRTHLSVVDFDGDGSGISGTPK